MMGQVVKATLDEAHSDLSVSEPTDQWAQKLFCFIDQTLRQMDLNTSNKNNVTQTWLLQKEKQINRLL